jgi:hypothetical protein
MPYAIIPIGNGFRNKIARTLRIPRACCGIRNNSSLCAGDAGINVTLCSYAKA